LKPAYALGRAGSLRAKKSAWPRRTFTLLKLAEHFRQNHKTSNFPRKQNLKSLKFYKIYIYKNALINSLFLRIVMFNITVQNIGILPEKLMV
jgi:hypothetical protein